MTRLAKKLATWADIEARAEDEALEILDGEILPKAAPSFDHGEAQASVVSALREPFGRGRGGPGGWRPATEVDVELGTHELVRPDLAGWRRDRVAEKPSGRPVRVRPDWICEVLSESNRSRDLVPKLRIYGRQR